MNDPDMGIWSYTYNALGELISQTDAKSQTSTISYDKLGRMTQRVEPEGTTNWQYDTKANGIGKLAQVTAPLGYKKKYSYAKA
jgi:YD repeat-containing protein